MEFAFNKTKRTKGDLRQKAQREAIRKQRLYYIIIYKGKGNETAFYLSCGIIDCSILHNILKHYVSLILQTLLAVKATTFAERR